MHGPLIEKSSYIDEDFSIPTTVEDLAVLLPGNSQYDDIDDLLVKLGKQHNRALLHSFVSKLFKVPQKLLINAENNRESLIPKSVLDAVYERRKKAKDAAAAVASAQSNILHQCASDPRIENSDRVWPKSENKVESSIAILGDKSIEYADPEHLCTECLPVYGDEIVGTLPVDCESDATPKVHRVCCTIAQKAVNWGVAESKKNRADLSSDESTCQEQIDNVRLPEGIGCRSQDIDMIEKPVKLQWPSYQGTVDEHEHFFPCEIVVHCQDRKLLLADCSEIVSELSEIIKTGSLTTNEHATLVFLVKIRCLDDLQKVMNSLCQVPSVMAVERRVRVHQNNIIF